MEPTIINTWISVVLRTYESYGCDSDELLKRTGINSSLLKNPGVRIKIPDYEELLKFAVSQTKDTCFGLRMVSYIKPTTFHALGFTLMASKTILDALERLSRYYRLISDEVKVNIINDANMTALCFSPFENRPLPSGTSVDAFMAVALFYARTLAGEKLIPSEVHFMHEKPTSIPHYSEQFNAPVLFSADDNRIYFHGKDILKPLEAANAELAFYNDQIVDEYLARFDDAQIEHQVRACIIELLSSGEPSLEKIAKTIGMSSRSLSRYLSQHQTSYRDILTDVRRQLSVQYLKQKNLSILDVAFRLGYADSSNFSRAFKIWFKVSPSQYKLNVK